VGVSNDTVASHERFAAKYDLQCYLLADPDGALMSRLGVRDPISGTGARTTFVIDKSGVVRHVFEKVSVKGHADAVLSAVAAL